MATPNLNRVAITGNLTRDPELRTTAGGSSLCKLRVAVNGRRKTADGTWEDKPNYVDVTAWGASAEAAAKYLAKGSPVAIDGRLDWSEWEQDGQRRQRLEVAADLIQFLGSRDRDADGPASPKAQIAADDDFTEPTKATDDFDDIPF
jgi:single-strand DNA-binding protein